MFVNFDMSAGQPNGDIPALVQLDPNQLAADTGCTSNADNPPAPKPDSPVTTMALGEEGGKNPDKPSFPGKKGNDPDRPMTTMALGEEGGGV